MLQMNCPICNGLIKSPLLGEKLDIECPQCREKVKIRNVVVSTQNFSIQRTALINRVSHYKKLLRDVEKDIEQDIKDKNVTKNTRSSADSLRSSLKDLLLAARDNFRLSLTYDLYVQINFNSIKRLARLINISSTGACVELIDRGQLPEDNTEITFHLLLPGHTVSLSVLARVIWSRRLANDTTSHNISMGVQFKDLDQGTRACIWNFIVESETSSYT
jgi:hypothetical protein